VIGVVVPELQNPIFPALLQVIETTLARHGYTVILCTQTPGGLPEDDYVQMLIERAVSGIVFISGLHADGAADPARYQALRERGLPLVFLNGYLAGVDAPFISNDDIASMDLAVRHLVALGHRRIGLAMGPPRFMPVRRKIEGFRSAMKKHLDVEDADGLVECSMFSLEGGAAALRHLLDRGITAVICGSDLMALGAIRAARNAGLQVPKDLSVVGYDDSLLIAFTDPPLTTIRQSVQAMAGAAVRSLLEEIGGSPSPRSEFLFSPELVVRGSTGAVPVDR
jgi:DNA-binding LacI/PurR family transcriptional regulator